MIRTQIQITPEQARALKQLAAREGKSVAEVIRISLDTLLLSGGINDPSEIRQKARQAAGRLKGSADIAVHHDDYFVDAVKS